MTLSSQIAKALRSAGFTCTAFTIDWTALLAYSLIAQGYVKARRFTLAGRRYSSDRGPHIIDLLNFIGCAFIEGNDAPKGGKLGKYIMYSRTDFMDCLLARTGFDLYTLELKQAEALKAAKVMRETLEAAAVAEANAIHVDDKFYDELKRNSALTGPERMEADKRTFLDLLIRNGAHGRKFTDFWKTFRLLKATAVEMYK